MQIKFKKKFVKQYKKLPQKLQKKVDEALFLFEKSPENKLLNLHELKWSKKWIFSINATWDLRLLLKKEWNFLLIEFIELWNHNNLYK